MRPLKIMSDARPRTPPPSNDSTRRTLEISTTISSNVLNLYVPGELALSSIQIEFGISMLVVEKSLKRMGGRIASVIAPFSFGSVFVWDGREHKTLFRK
jgi:hypothetical protein